MAMKYKNVTMGAVEAVFNKLGGEKGAKRFLRGELEVVEKKHTIDCDAPPFVPEGWEVVEHQSGGQFVCNLDGIELYLADEQRQGSIDGHELRRKLEGRLSLNANVLDYLLKHPELIPDKWRGKYIFFWGTIYRDSDGNLYVRCLDWDHEEWSWRFGWLDGPWDDDYPALLRK